MLGVTRRAEGIQKHRQGTLASKGARKFLTDVPGAHKVEARELGRVLEDGDVAWHTEQPRGRFAETSSVILKNRTREGY